MNDATNANPNGDRPNPWLDAEEVAPLLSTTAHTLRRLARQGRSPVVVRRIGGRWRFSRRSVEEFIDGSGAQEAS
ncbi:MAG: helix-turn-helix domain-containing protein [Acidimicrobiales bacterium]